MRLLIVDDQKLLLDALVDSLKKQEGFDIIGAITEANLADVACARLKPDVVLMDICTQTGITGIYAAEKIKQSFPHIKVVLMTGFEEMSFMERARIAQADSFIYKSSSIEEFVSCLKATMKGEHCYPVFENSVTFGSTHEHLTSRELDILRLFCQSKSRKEMADLLNVSPSTINFHINNMLSKTGYKKLMSLAMEAANKGYIRLEEEYSE